MKRTFSTQLRRALPVAALVTSGVLIAGHPSFGEAQTTANPPHTQTASQDQQLAKQIEELRAQVARLQAALDQQRQQAQQPTVPSAQKPAPAMGMGEMSGMPKPPMGGMDKMEKSAMPGGMMDMDKGEMGMPPESMKMPEGMMMDEIGKMSGKPGMPAKTASPSRAAGNTPSGGAMSMPTGTGGPAKSSNAARSMSSLPGVPGTSHLYHIASTGFFLDQPQLTLTPQQQSALNAIKERALLERGNAERRVQQGEQELWTLTAADQPDAAKIQGKAREIEQVRTNQRLAFIQAVGEATKVLTAEQRTSLLGTASMPAK